MKGWAYETYWKGENLVRSFVFDSLEDYLSYLEKATVQDVFATCCSSELGSFEFTGTESLDEAIDLARFGWREGFNRLAHMTDQVKRALDYAPETRRTHHDYIGFAPDVKAYMEGSPLSMINAPAVRKPHVSIFMNTSIDGFAEPEDVYRRGAATVALCDVIETCGVMVDLHLFEMSFMDKEVLIADVVAKARDERLNMMKLHFPLCHPSWIRRLNFRLVETMPNVTRGWMGSYGIPAERPLMKRILDIEGEAALVPTFGELEKGIKELKPASDESGLIACARLIADAIDPKLPEDKRLVFKGA